MFKRKNISINSVLLDADNARHGDKSSQRDIHAWMAGEEKEIGQKVLKLAAEIAREGISPLEIPAVVHAAEGAGKPWIVVEGNRRVAALKFLNDPKLCPDLRLRRQYEKLKAHAATSISRKIEFVIFENIEAARYWIETRHGGENGGAGVINWGPMEFDNFAARFGKRTTNRPAVELLNYALERGLISYEQFKAVPVTTLYRLLSTPEFREKIGCDLVKGSMCRIADEPYFNRAVTRVLEVLASGEKTVTDLKTKAQRLGFAEEMQREGGWSGYKAETPRNLTQSADEYDTSDSDEDIEGSPSGEPGEQTPKTSRGTKTPSWDRKSLFVNRRDGLLIPSDHTKAKNIVAELRRLKTSGDGATPIAVSMLLRALIEISTNRYYAACHLKPEQDFPRQIARAADHMLKNSYLSEDQHAVVIRMSRETESMLHVKTIQKYVHSDAFHPTGEVLNTLWDQIASYVAVCWRVAPIV